MLDVLVVLFKELHFWSSFFLRKKKSLYNVFHLYKKENLMQWILSALENKQIVFLF